MEIKRITEVSNYIDHAVDIVFFDIDNTILEVESGVGLVPWACALEDYAKGNSNLTEERIQKYITDYIRNMEMVLVEQEVRDVIHSISQKNIPMIALTNRPLATAETTSIQLKQLGIDFSNHPFEPKTCQFDSFKRPALFRDGIITGNSNNKGLLLKEFLNCVGFKPCKLIFIDDSKDFVRDVEEKLKEISINVVALRYGFLDEKVNSFIFTPKMVPEELR